MMIRFGLVLAALLIVCPNLGHSHCHNNGSGPEDPMIVRGNKVWPPEKKNSDGVYEIVVWVNNIYRPRPAGNPSLSPDCGDAGEIWSEIEFQGSEIKFKYNMNESHQFYANVKDNRNVMAYMCMGRHNPTIAFTYHVNVDGNRINELDVGFNYYKDFKKHGQSGLYYRIKEIAVHELGHVAGLEDVYYDPDLPVSRTNSPDYAHYSMNGHFPSKNTHWRESLNCEDKYALDQKYSYGP